MKFLFEKFKLVSLKQEQKKHTSWTQRLTICNLCIFTETTIHNFSVVLCCVMQWFRFYRLYSANDTLNVDKNRQDKYALSDNSCLNFYKVQRGRMNHECMPSSPASLVRWNFLNFLILQAIYHAIYLEWSIMKFLKSRISRQYQGNREYRRTNIRWMTINLMDGNVEGPSIWKMVMWKAVIGCTKEARWRHLQLISNSKL